ncbi:hypothetical protein QYM36_006842 [Artemia franciscana]|uniref:Reverse transcriptase domain-containing protein n=1 Tax=Artemia franciscana TaxID=6661 RepID=A0AA88L864_ARTSF|nr:hypothetical protein QYM36_018542 [Artemia franciscana]KAK2716489.1 hypothetical protein QYM36_006842 [Artemia franciscana]
MGEDLVHNKMLRALPPNFLVPLLYLFNRCWESGSVPSAWNSSILVPIYKGKGDRSDPASYRPIALTSCIAKLYEKMIKLRFEPLIDNSLIAEQAGFRKGRSTLDNLIQLDHDIKKAFTRKRVVSAVFFDIKKAYDTLDPLQSLDRLINLMLEIISGSGAGQCFLIGLLKPELDPYAPLLIQSH